MTNLNQHRDEILTRYRGGENATSLAKFFKTHRHRMCDILRSWGVEIRRNITPDEQRQKIVKMYNAGATTYEIADNLGLRQMTICENLQRWGADMRRSGPRRRLALQEDFFSKINTDEKAYWFGFLYADGSLGCHIDNKDNPTTVRLSLARKNESQILKFKMALGSGSDIKYSKQPDCVHDLAYIIISCARMCDDLAAKGVILRKTHNCVDPLPHVPPKLQHHFMRGFFDGDGWLSHGRYGKSQTYGGVFGMAVHNEWAETVKFWFICNTALPDVKIVPATNCTFVSQVQWSGCQQIEAALELLYKDSTPATRLDRKYKIFQAMKKRSLYVPDHTGKRRSKSRTGVGLAVDGMI